MLDASELGQPEYEVREGRNDLRASCLALSERLDGALAQLKALEAAVGTLDGDVVTLHEDLTAKGGVPVDVVAQASSVSVVAPEGVEVTNPPDVASVTSAVQDSSETFDSNAWAIAGLLVGFGVLAWVYKLVRP